MVSLNGAIQQEWISSQHISAYTIKDISVASLVLLSEHILQTLEQASEASLCIGILLDISSPGVGLPFLALTGRNIVNVGLTSIGQQKLTHLLNSKPQFRVYVAVVVSNSLSGKITIGRTRGDNAPDRLLPKVFQERTAAERWLAEQLV